MVITTRSLVFCTNTKHHAPLFKPSIERKFSPNWRCVAALLLMGSLSAGVRAQANLNDGAGVELQRQQQRERNLREQQERMPVQPSN